MTAEDGSRYSIMRDSAFAASFEDPGFPASNPEDSPKHTDPDRAKNIFDFFTKTFIFIPNLDSICLKDPNRRDKIFKITPKYDKDGISEIEIEATNIQTTIKYRLTKFEAEYVDEGNGEEGVGKEAISAFERQLDSLILPTGEATINLFNRAQNRF